VGFNGLRGREGSERREIYLPLFNDTVSKSDHTEVNNWKTATNEFEEI
jgi:hypothetical protein